MMLENIYGWVEIRETIRYENGSLIFGGYSIRYDRNGNEISRTNDADNFRIYFDKEVK